MSEKLLNGINTTDMLFGEKLALQGVKEQIDTICCELSIKGIDTGLFSTLKAYMEDRICECEGALKKAIEDEE